MLNKIIRTSLTAGLLVLGISFSGVATANAGNLSLSYSNGHGTIQINKQRHKSVKRGHYRQTFCGPRKAVRKAANRLGVRRAHIDRVGRKFIIVKGRKRGKRIEVAFERRSPRCEIAWVERKRSHKQYGGSYGHNTHGHKKQSRMKY